MTQLLQVSCMALDSQPGARGAFVERLLYNDTLKQVMLVCPHQCARALVVQQLVYFSRADTAMLERVWSAALALLPQAVHFDSTCCEYFVLLCEVADHLHSNGSSLLKTDKLVEEQVQWLRAFAAASEADVLAHQGELAGRLRLAASALQL